MGGAYRRGAQTSSGSPRNQTLSLSIVIQLAIAVRARGAAVWICR